MGTNHRELESVSESGKSVKGRLVKRISTVINAMRTHNREIQLPVGQGGHRSPPGGSYD